MLYFAQSCHNLVPPEVTNYTHFVLMVYLKVPLQSQLIKYLKPDNSQSSDIFRPTLAFTYQSKIYPLYIINGDRSQ